MKISIENFKNLFRIPASFYFNFLLLFILPNLFFILLGQTFNLSHALFNLDYCLLFFIPNRYWRFLVFILLFSLDCFLALSGSFFLSLEEVLSIAWEFAIKIDVTNFLSRFHLFFLYYLITLVFFYVLSRKVKTQKAPFAFYFLIIFIFIADSLNGSNGLLKNETTQHSINIGNSRLVQFAQTLIKKRVLSPFIPLGDTQHASHLFNLEAGKKHYLLVVVESLGKPHSEELLNQLFEPMSKLAKEKNLTFTIGSTPFEGATSSGEMRELCALKTSYPFNIEDIPIKQCLAAKLKEKNYDVLSIHPFTKYFYRRNLWYPKLGFNQSLFKEELKGEMCGAAFEGTCMNSYYPLIAKRLSKDEKNFTYLLTLHSHFPLDTQIAANSSFDCEQNTVTKQKEKICTWAKLIHLELTNLAQTLKDLDLSSFEMIIVGDHAPPFIRAENRAQFSEKEVPFLYVY